MRLPRLRFLGPALKLWRARRAQALLSMLGVIAGVSGVVIVVALGNGAERELQAALGSLGAGSVIVRDNAAGTPQQSLHRRHAERIQALAGDSLLRASVQRRFRASVDSGHSAPQNIHAIATDRHYSQIFRLPLRSGRFIGDHDVRGGQRVCVVGRDLARDLFPNGQVLGEQLRIAGDWYRVVGWLAGASRHLPRLEALNLGDEDRRVYLPVTALSGPAPDAPVDEIVLQFHDDTRMENALRLLKRVVGNGAAEDNIEYIVPIRLLRQKQAIQAMFQYFLLGVAGLMLTVGGIGIMNMMMVNVISRRPEIGLRMAVGATRRDITLQFITESLVIAVSGGFLGIITGYLVAIVIDWTTQWPIAYSTGPAVIGFAVAVTVGVVFGSYPALQAASVTPMQSLNRP